MPLIIDIFLIDIERSAFVLAKFALTLQAIVIKTRDNYLFFVAINGEKSMRDTR